MGTSKILIDGVGIDLTQDTVAAGKMLSGITAHNSNGDSVTGNIQTWAGQQASGAKSITANGTYDVTEFASAAVNVEGWVTATGTVVPEHATTIDIVHNLGTRKIIVLLQLQDTTIRSAWSFVMGSWISDDILSLALTNKTYNTTYSTVASISNIIQSAAGSAINAGASGTSDFYHTPAGYEHNVLNMQKIDIISDNSCNLRSRYSFIKGLTYSYLVIGLK